MDINKLKEWLIRERDYEKREACLSEEEVDFEYHTGQADAFDSTYNKILELEKSK